MLGTEVIIGDEGSVTGLVNAERVEIFGTVLGTIRAAQRCALPPAQKWKVTSTIRCCRSITGRSSKAQRVDDQGSSQPAGSRWRAGADARPVERFPSFQGRYDWGRRQLACDRERS